MFHKSVTSLFILLFFAVIFFFFILVQTDVVAFAFIKIGIPYHYVLMALLATLLGSFINIPLKTIPQENMTDEERINFFGATYVIPIWKRKETLLAVNIGGAVIPTLISVYLLFRTELYLAALGATVLITLVTFKLARPMRGVGIVLPFFVSPVLAALISGLIAHNNAPVIAYISGTLGTLIGGDLLNLKKIRNLGAPVASIGGAGTFDGIFLTGILSVLLSVFLA